MYIEMTMVTFREAHTDEKAQRHSADSIDKEKYEDHRWITSANDTAMLSNGNHKHHRHYEYGDCEEQ